MNMSWYTPGCSFNNSNSRIAVKLAWFEEIAMDDWVHGFIFCSNCENEEHCKTAQCDIVSWVLGSWQYLVDEIA